MTTPLIRVRVSTLERFRAWLEEDYVDEKELIDQILCGQVGDAKNWQMEAGTAWHAMLDDAAAHVTQGDNGRPYYRHVRFCFTEDTVKTFALSRPPGRTEVTFKKRYGRVEVKGTVDWIKGLCVRDAKTKFGSPDLAGYEDSLQWRFYLDLTGSHWFRYDLYDAKEPDDSGLIDIKGLVSASYCTYPGIEDDLFDWCQRFRAWAADRGLLPFLLRVQERHPAEREHYPCDVCGRPANEAVGVPGYEDAYVCGAGCGLVMFQALEHHEECGHR